MRHGLTRWSRNGCAVTVRINTAVLGHDADHLSAPAASCGYPPHASTVADALATAAVRPAAVAGRGGNVDFNAYRRRRRAAVDAAAYHHPLALTRLATAFLTPAVAAGATARRFRHLRAAAVCRRWHAVPPAADADACTGSLRHRARPGAGGQRVRLFAVGVLGAAR